MEVEILNFIADRKGGRIGYVDFRVTYSEEKNELFRQVGYFEKDNKKWLAIGSVERDGKWLPRYQRKPTMSKMFDAVLEQLDMYIQEHSVLT